MRIFLSHSSKDKEDVRRLAVALQSEGIKAWLDEWEICVGDAISRKVSEGIEQCDYLAIWLTKHAVQSGWVEREWQAKYHVEVEQRRLAVLPLLADSCDIPALLRDKKYADFRSDFAVGLAELLQTLLSPERKAAEEKLRSLELDAWYLANQIHDIDWSGESWEDSRIGMHLQDIRHSLEEHKRIFRDRFGMDWKP